MPEELGEEPRIMFGETRYTSDGARLQDTIMRQAADVFYAESLLKEGVGKFKDGQWKGESPGQLAERAVAFTQEDEYAMRDIVENTKAVELATSELVDIADTENVQIIVARNGSKDIVDQGGYMFLVVYPPEEAEKGDRRREVSFPTASCHVVAAVGLLDESFIARVLDRKSSQLSARPRKVDVGEREYTMRLLKVAPVSDNALEETVSTHGRTGIDKLSQLGFAAIDKFSGIKGEHIDPIAAIRDQQYAIQYALACHRGIGKVINKKIILPPLTGRKD